MAQGAQHRGRPAPDCENSNDGYNNNQTMFYDEVVSSDSESTGDGKSKSKRRVPKCARCKNHNIHAKVKDHKDVCPTRFCICSKCIATSVRQREMKKQVAIKRKLVRYKKVIEKQKKIRNFKKLPTARANDSEEVPAPEPPASNNHNHIVNSAKSCAINVVKPTSLTAPSVPTIQNHESPHVLNLSAPNPEDNLKTNVNDCNLTETEQTEILVGFSSRVMKRFGYSWEALSLIYVILKDTKKDVELAMKRISEDVTSTRSLFDRKILDYFSNLKFYNLMYIS